MIGSQFAAHRMIIIMNNLHATSSIRTALHYLVAVSIRRNQRSGVSDSTNWIS